MVDTRFKPRRVRSRLAAARGYAARSFRGLPMVGRAAHVFGEYLQDQRVESPNGNRWTCVAIERESGTQSGDLRTLSPP
jgi:hypothetical protein